MPDTFLFQSSIQIILSKNRFQFPENRQIQLKVISEIGEGSYGKVYRSEENYAIKIFKHSVMGTFQLTESEETTIPDINENRELIFYFELLKRNQDLFSCSIHHIIQPYSIGILKENVSYQTTRLLKNSYFVILPLCIPFYRHLEIKHLELIQMREPNHLFEKYKSILPLNHSFHFGIYFTLQVMKQLALASLYLETEYKIYNLDFKMNNVMFLQNLENNSNLTFEDLIVIDFSLIKHLPRNSQEIFHYENLIQQKYFIWPYSGTSFIHQIPSYSIAINGLELLFGKRSVERLPSYRLMKKVVDNIRALDENLYLLFYETIVEKSSTQRLLDSIDNYLQTISS